MFVSGNAPLFLRLSGGLLAAGVPGEAGPEEEEKELLAMVRVGLGGKARRGDPERQTAGGYGGLRARSPGAAVAGGELPHAPALASPRFVSLGRGREGGPRDPPLLDGVLILQRAVLQQALLGRRTCLIFSVRKSRLFSQGNRSRERLLANRIK